MANPLDDFLDMLVTPADAAPLRPSTPQNASHCLPSCELHCLPNGSRLIRRPYSPPTPPVVKENC
jgi:hypothetical protein